MKLKKEKGKEPKKSWAPGIAFWQDSDLRDPKEVRVSLTGWIYKFREGKKTCK